MSDFYAGILVAWQLDGVKFALGPTIATTRARLAGFGGYAALENRPADDLLVGRLIAEQGYEVALLRYAVETVSDYQSMRRAAAQAPALDRGDAPHAAVGTLRVAVHARLAMVAGGGRGSSDPRPSRCGYLGAYFALRAAMTWMIGVHGLKPARLMERDAADSGVGRGGVLASGWPASCAAASAGAARIITFRTASWCPWLQIARVNDAIRR